jgi:hypothetical protein
VEQALDFVTNQRGEVHLDDHQFARSEVRWDGKRLRLYIADDAVKVGDSAPWRRIVIRTDAAEEIFEPINSHRLTATS